MFAHGRRKEEEKLGVCECYERRGGCSWIVSKPRKEEGRELSDARRWAGGRGACRSIGQERRDVPARGEGRRDWGGPRGTQTAPGGVEEWHGEEHLATESAWWSAAQNTGAKRGEGGGRRQGCKCKFRKVQGDY